MLVKAVWKQYKETGGKGDQMMVSLKILSSYCSVSKAGPTPDSLSFEDKICLCLWLQSGVLGRVGKFWAEEWHN